MEQTNLTPEQTKRIAEWAGRKIVGNRIVDVCVRGLDGLPEEYTPDTNDAQAFELLRKLIDLDYIALDKADDDTYIVDPFVSTEENGEGPTLNLATCHAVLALEGEG